MMTGSNTSILDAYKASTTSLKLAIENFGKVEAGKIIVLLGAIAELVEESLQVHTVIAELLNQYHWADVVLVGGDFLKISHPFRSFASAAEAKTWLQQQHFENAHLLVKGSRSMKMETVLED